LKSVFENCKPGVGRRTLLFMGGFVWVCVGIMLLAFSYHWLGAYQGTSVLPYISAGAVLALAVHHFGFLRIVDKNLGRLLTVEEKRCVFSFMPWRSYVTVAVMVGMGSALRHSPIPKHYLSVLYIGIGFGLILSSVRYFRVLLRQ